MMIEEKYNIVREALVGVVDCDDLVELRKLKDIIRFMEPTDDFQKENRWKSIAAIDALITTHPSIDG